MIYKIDKPKNKQTVADLILHLSNYDLDSEIVWYQSNNPKELILYSCIEDSKHPYYRPKYYDLEFEAKQILTIPIEK